jgi:predicted ATPase
VVVIQGDAGAGKTRLAAELAARARLDGAVVVAVRAVEADRSDAWSGVFGMARGGLLEAPGAAGAPPPMLTQLRGTALPESLGKALSEVLQAVADEHPVLLFVDDAQWLDRESLLALGAAARDLARSPALLVITAAPQPPCSELDELRTRIGRELRGTVVRVGALGRDDVHELARRALPSYGAAQLDRLARRVLADSAGIALLVVALLSAVAGGLTLDEDAGAWPEPNRTLNDTLPGELPDNVVAAIRINYRRLSATAQRVLVAAAVLGGRVGGAKLGRASELSGDVVAQALDELEWQSWLTVERRGYAFVARIVRDVIDRDMVREGERQRIRDAAERTA